MENPFRALSKVNPQKEDGHREINNECYHALMAARLPGSVYQIVLTVIDRTWGFGKHDAPISLKDFTDATGLSRQGAIAAIKEAENLRIIIVSRATTTASIYLLNKHYDTWLASQPQLTSEDVQLVNPNLPDQSTPVDQSSQPQLTSASQVATPAAEPIKKEKETIKETIKESGPKKKRCLFDNILMTEPEYNKLVAQFGEDGTRDRLENLSLYKKSRGKKYASDYATILTWEKKDRKGGQGGTHQGSPRQLRPRESYSKPED